MRHNRAINHLGRKSAHRKAMLSNMTCSLILHKRIRTTVAKAKALKSYAEPIVTKSKEDTTHSRRIVFSYLKNKYATAELFRTIAPKIADRPGGYLRVLHTGFRAGDGAEMALVEFVDFNEAALATAPKKEAKRTSTRRSRRKGAETAAPAAEKAERTPKKEAAPVAEEAPAAEAAETAAEAPAIEAAQTSEAAPAAEAVAPAPAAETAAQTAPAAPAAKAAPAATEGTLFPEEEAAPSAEKPSAE